jgi:hypothetical protein
MCLCRSTCGEALDSSTQVNTSVCMIVSSCMHECVCMYGSVCAQQTQGSVNLRVIHQVNMCVYELLCVCICVYTHINLLYIYIYIYIYTYITLCEQTYHHDHRYQTTQHTHTHTYTHMQPHMQPHTHTYTTTRANHGCSFAKKFVRASLKRGKTQDPCICTNIYTYKCMVLYMNFTINIKLHDGRYKLWRPHRKQSCTSLRRNDSDPSCARGMVKTAVTVIVTFLLIIPIHIRNMWGHTGLEGMCMYVCVCIRIRICIRKNA